MKKMLYHFMAAGLVSLASISSAQVTNVYHFEREFVPVAYTNGVPSAYAVIMGADQLTGIVGPTNVRIISEQTYATDYDSVAWGYDTPEAAWAAVVSNRTAFGETYAFHTYDNAGWVKGTRQAYGAWGAFLWHLQNTITFESSMSDRYIHADGATNVIASVLVGTIGDFCPQTIHTDVGPVLNTNYLGAGHAEEYIANADLSAYYKLVPFAYLGVNHDDSDGDGIPDFADGYDFDAGNSFDNISSNDFFTPWKLALSGYADPALAQIRITYSASDPIGVSVATNGYTPANGHFRLWRRQADQPRGGASFLSGGDYIPPGTYAATSLGFSASARLVDVYIEPVMPGTNQTLLVEIDPDGTGPKGFVCVDNVSFEVLSITLEPITLRPGNGAIFPLYNPCGIELGSNATYEIQITPSNIPNDQIVWRVTTGNVSFISGDSGRSVNVRGDGSGPATLTIDIGNFWSLAPTIEMQVLAVQTSKVFIFVIADTNGVTATTQSRIDDLLRDVNDVYKQVGMRFVQQGSSVIVTNPAWLDISAANNFQEFMDMCSITQNTSGIELYFVQDIDSGIRGLNYSSSGPDAGCAVSTNGDFRTVAHELGHACGLDDIYDVDLFGTPLPDALVRQGWAPNDWNGGSSPLYYQATLNHKALIGRLLMYGFGGSGISKADIPSGKVYGYMNVGATRIISNVTVGLQNMTRTPSHW